VLREYEEKLKIARETGKGIIVRFQEKSNYKMAVNNYDCPHCGAYHGSKKEDKWNTKGTKIGQQYETPEDIKFMCNNIGYSWTEDIKCSNCGEIYSQSNGC
jgi:hypothetical protein